MSVDSVGRVGEVLVGITGSRGHLPLFFGADELEPGYASRVVKDTVSRFGLRKPASSLVDMPVVS